MLVGRTSLSVGSARRSFSRLVPLRTSSSPRTAATTPSGLQSISNSTEPATPSPVQEQQPSTAPAATPVPPPGFWQNVLAQNIHKDKLAQLGFGAFCAYGVISNLNAACMIALAWVTVVKTTGAMPLAAGNWPNFLAVYAGLWVTSNFMRPIRVSLAIAVAPFFDGGLTTIMKWTGQKNKIVAFGIMLLMIAAGSISTVVLAIAVCGGFSVGPT